MKEKNNNLGFRLNFGGLFLIFIGLVYFLPTTGIIEWGSIWIFFAILPAFWVAYGGWRQYQEQGYLSRQTIVGLMWGLFPFAFIGLIFSGVDVGRLWPLVLVLVGISIMIGGAVPDEKHPKSE